MALPDNVPLDKNLQPYPLVYLQTLVDDAIKGLMRSLGDAGEAPTNQTGNTLLKAIALMNSEIQSRLVNTYNMLGEAFYPETLTTTPLAASATYTGTSKDLLLSRAGFVSILTYADQAGTAYIEQSLDNSNWDLTESVVVSASTGTKLKKEAVARYVRAKYVNGGSAQSTFRFGWRHAIA